MFTDQNVHFSFGLSAPQGGAPCARDPRRWATSEIKLQRAHSCAPCPRPLSLRRSQRGQSASEARPTLPPRDLHPQAPRLGSAPRFRAGFLPDNRPARAPAAALSRDVSAPAPRTPLPEGRAGRGGGWGPRPGRQAGEVQTRAPGAGAMTLFHFGNCFALAYFPYFITYKCSGL